MGTSPLDTAIAPGPDTDGAYVTQVLAALGRVEPSHEDPLRLVVRDVARLVAGAPVPASLVERAQALAGVR
jgi:hypothetical protein